MKRLTVLLTLLLTVIISKAGQNSFQRDGNEVTINLKDHYAFGPSAIRLQVINDLIIRVEATGEQTFPQKKSLIIIPQNTQTPFTVNEDSGKVIVSTHSVRAEVDESTGRVLFFDHQGHLLLAEKEQGKMLKPFEVPNLEMGVGRQLTDSERNGWTWRAVFNSPYDEAFYGLGQHQSEELNMKGRNEELFQYNTKVSVPFVMSNRNYGLLWDSYSYCRFGNPEDYRQLNQTFTLYDKFGKKGKLTGTYTEHNGKEFVRDEDSLYFEFNLPEKAKNKVPICGTDLLPKGIHLNDAHVTYEGYLEAPKDADYHFLLYYAGYIRVYMDDMEVVKERWRTAWNPNSYKFTIPLKQGKRTKLRIEWSPDGDVSYCGLRVASSLSKAEQEELSIWSEMSRDLDYYFIAGKNMDEVISGYRQLTGKAPVYPKWAMGFWQSRERYKNSNDIETTLKTFRNRHIPIDNIVQDWNYWKLDSWGDHSFEALRYPNPQAMIDSIHNMHRRFMISVWPKFYSSVDHYKAMNTQGWMYQQAISDSIYDWLGFMGSFYDAYSLDARRLYWKQINQSLYSKYHFGIDAWWMDATEPNVRDCTPMWYRKSLCGPTALGSSTEYFNAYSLMNAEAIYSGQREANPNQRVFLLTRSGFAGEQRYGAAIWSGDIGTRWEDMRAQMTAGLNFCMSGIPFWGMDIGGFCVEKRYVQAQKFYDKTGKENEDLKEWRELQARWSEFGCFVPLYRAHGQWPLREVWNIAPEGHPTYESIVRYDRLRYRLMPYLYSMAGAVHFKDYTMMRALVMDFNGDEKVNDIKDQWMFGPALMTCPVSEYKARSRKVYLPRQSGWYDLYTGQHYEGGMTITADAPLTQIPVFVPEGSIIPFGPAIEWSDEKPAELINLYVYMGRNGLFTLYEDEGTNNNYEQGAYATIQISYDEAGRKLTIENREGSFNGMLKHRRFNIVTIDAKHPFTLNLNNPHGKLITYDGYEMIVKL